MSFSRGVEAFCDKALRAVFQYSYTPISSDQIRLLYLKSGSANNLLEIAFRAPDAEHDSEYEAISYC